MRREEKNAKGNSLLDSEHRGHPKIIDWKCQSGEGKNPQARSRRERELGGKDVELGRILKKGKAEAIKRKSCY